MEQLGPREFLSKTLALPRNGKVVSTLSLTAKSHGIAVSEIAIRPYTPLVSFPAGYEVLPLTAATALSESVGVRADRLTILRRGRASIQLQGRPVVSLILRANAMYEEQGTLRATVLFTDGTWQQLEERALLFTDEVVLRQISIPFQEVRGVQSIVLSTYSQGIFIRGMAFRTVGTSHTP